MSGIEVLLTVVLGLGFLGFLSIGVFYVLSMRRLRLEYCQGVLDIFYGKVQLKDNRELYFLLTEIDVGIKYFNKVPTRKQMRRLDTLVDKRLFNG